MHLPGNPRLVRRAGRFRQREGIHVGAQKDPGAGLSGVRRDPCPADTRARRESEARQSAGDDSRRPRLLEAELGVLVKIAPRLDQRLELLLGETLEQALEHAPDYKKELMIEGLKIDD
jgi:hypothetical protein